MATIVHKQIPAEMLTSAHLTTDDCKTQKNGHEVMQVLVVHLDLFTCGTCGNQSTDILEHLLHKIQHPFSNIYHCELCKAVVSSQDSLIQHYFAVHALPKLRVASATTQEQHKPYIILADNDTVTNNQILYEPKMEKNGIVEEGSSDEKGGYMLLDNQEANNLILHDHGMFCVRDKSAKDTSKETTVSVKSSSRTKSKQLLKTAMRTLSKSGSDNVGSGGNHISSTNPAAVTGARSKPRKPPILQRRISMTPEPKKSTLTLVSEQTMTHPQTTKQNHPKVEREELSRIMFVDNKKVLGNCVLPTATSTSTSTSAAAASEELEKNLQCLHCDFGSKNQEELSEHMSTKHTQQGMELPVSLQIATLDDSPIKKTSEKPSGKPRKNRQPRKVERQDLPGVYPCTQCGKNFQRLRYLRKHAHVHKTDKKFVCEECGKLFKCKGYLKVHKRKMHEGKNVFKCNQCDFTSWINAAIHAHRQIHSQGSVLCDICGYAYTDKATLAKHKRVHDPRRPFACNFPGCTWRFKTEIMCRAHIRAHTTEGKFGCQYCGYLFRHKHHLQRHEANMHGVKHEKSRQQKTPSNMTLAQDIVVSSTDFITDLDHHGDLTQPMLVIKSDGSAAFDAHYTTLLNDVIHAEEITTNGSMVVKQNSYH